MNTRQQVKKGMKARYMFEVFANEYTGQDVVLYGSSA